MTTPPVVLRARTVTDILDVAVGLYRHNFGTLLGVVALVHGPLLAAHAAAMALLISAVLQISTEPTPGWGFFAGLLGGLVALLVAGAAAIVFAPLSTGAVTLAVSDLYLGRPVTVREVYRGVLRWWGRLIGTQFLIQLLASAVSQGASLFMVPAMIAMPLAPAAGIGLIALTYLATILAMVAVYVFMLAAIPAIVVENRGWTEAIGRSFNLVKPWWKHALWAYTLLGLMALTPMLMAGSVSGLVALEGGMARLPLVAAIAGALALLAQLLVMPITMAGRVVIYYDLRVRQEGLDLDMMAANLDRKAATPAGLPAPAPLTRKAPPPPPPPPPPGRYPPAPLPEGPAHGKGDRRGEGGSETRSADSVTASGSRAPGPNRCESVSVKAVGRPYSPRDALTDTL